MKNKSKADGQTSDAIQPKRGAVFFKRPKSPIYVKQFGDGGYEVVELWRHMMSFSSRSFGEHFGFEQKETPVFITEAQYNRAKKLCLAKLLTKSI